MLLALRNIGIRFDQQPLFEGLEFTVNRNDRLCLVGRNGSGKSTILRIAAGLMTPDMGEVHVEVGVRVVYLEQEAEFSDYPSVADYVESGLSAVETGNRHLVQRILADIGVDGAAKPDRLSGGEARRAALARALVSSPDVLLLDEPTNHLDLATIEWLEERLSASQTACVIISHDRAFLRRLTRKTLWLHGGRLQTLDDGFAAFADWSETLLRQEADSVHKLNRRIAAEARWSVEGITARRKRNQGRMRRLQQLRAVRAKQIARIGRPDLALERGGLSGRLVVEADAIAKRLGDRQILHDFSTRIQRGDRIGIIGRNGAGKTTLLKLLTGQLAPDQGHVRLGTNLTPLYLDQRRESLDPEKSVWETLCEGGGDQILVRGRPIHVVAYLRQFLFAESQARSPVKSLSGGERNRLVLAKTLARPSNFLIMDEPTNDLDMETLELLQEVLSDYDGTLLLVSHDRDFLDALATSTIVLDGDGQAIEYAGGFSDYLRQRRPALTGAKAGRPTASPAKPAAKRSSPSKRLGYRDQRDLEILPGKLIELEGDIERLEQTLSDTGFFERDPTAFKAAADRLETARAALAAAEERWLELELRREELANKP